MPSSAIPGVSLVAGSRGTAAVAVPRDTGSRPAGGPRRRDARPRGRAGGWRGQGLDGPGDTARRHRESGCASGVFAAGADRAGAGDWFFGGSGRRDGGQKVNIDMAALHAIEVDRGISVNELLETIKSALLTAYRHTQGHQMDASIDIDRKTGVVRVIARETD